MDVARTAVAAVGGIALASMGLASIHRAEGIETPANLSPSRRSGWIAGARSADAANILLTASPLGLLGGGIASGNRLLLAAGIAGTATAAIGLTLLSDAS